MAEFRVLRKAERDTLLAEIRTLGPIALRSVETMLDQAAKLRAEGVTQLDVASFAEVVRLRELLTRLSATLGRIPNLDEDLRALGKRFANALALLEGDSLTGRRGSNG